MAARFTVASLIALVCSAGAFPQNMNVQSDVAQSGIGGGAGGIAAGDLGIPMGGPASLLAVQNGGAPAPGLPAFPSAVIPTDIFNGLSGMFTPAV